MNMELQLPNSWSNLTLAELKVLMVSDDIIERVSCVTNRSKADVRDMPIALVEAANEHLTQLVAREETKFHRIIELEGREYGFIPNWDEFSTGEWIDMEQYLADFWPNVDKIMAILYRPVVKKSGKKYTIEKYTAAEDVSVFESMPADHISGTLLFFSTIKNRLLNNMQQSLLKVARVAATTTPNGGGIQSYITYRGKAYYIWMRLQNYLFK
jgi:hypothetical protein